MIVDVGFVPLELGSRGPLWMYLENAEIGLEVVILLVRGAF